MSFDPIAPVYDATRVFDKIQFNHALDYIVQRFPPQKFLKLFEPGIGTGRIAIPFAERGYKVTGADISGEMLKVLKKKLSAIKPPLPVNFIKQDITSLPFPDASFNIAVAVHVFHLIPEWQKAIDEVFRILTAEAPLILLFTGSGMEYRPVNEKYEALCAEHGHPVRRIGTQKKNDLPDYVTGLGRRVETINDRWTWRQSVSIGKFVADYRKRNYSSSRLVPDDIHLKVMDKLEAGLITQYGKLDVDVTISNQISMTLVLPG
jgi:ubiquinone/menaquinone biosynthesis C-methylase UbiE